MRLVSSVFIIVTLFVVGANAPILAFARSDPASIFDESQTGTTLAGAKTTVIVAGADQTCAITPSGSVKCWGNNRFGEVGGGEGGDVLAPVDVIGLQDGARVIATGGSPYYIGYPLQGAGANGFPLPTGGHTCAVTLVGGVKCWGYNGRGELGDGTQLDSGTPVDVVGLASGMVSVTVGGNHTCALTNSGGVKCWGANWTGQLGDGSYEDRHTAVDVVGLSSGVKTIVAGESHTCAVMTAGQVKCWGANFEGQLGDGTTTTHPVPINVSTLSAGIQSIATGREHNCVVTVAGAVKCWGANTYGQLGDGTTTNRSTPVDVLGLSSDIKSVTAGQFHTCALTIQGGVKCWGGNYDGQLGTGTAMQRSMPVDVTSGLDHDVQAIAAGDSHTCAVTIADKVRCWGSNLRGQLGDGTANRVLTPTEATNLNGSEWAVDAGMAHTCAITGDDRVTCWGFNASGQLGDGSTAHRWQPLAVTGDITNAVSIATGPHHTCALTADGRASCWGANWAGQLGDGTDNDHVTPVAVSVLPDPAAAIATGDGYTCALTTGGGAKCWGWNRYGGLGDGTDKDRWIPVDVTGLTSGTQSISIGDLHTCAVTTAGGVKCWGYNDRGQLGDGTTIDRWTPVDVIGLTAGVQSVAPGEWHTCAVMQNGGVKCWGYNAFGQLGDGTETDRLTPVDVVGLTGATKDLVSGDTFSCALSAAGGVRCWGYNVDGQLGDGTPIDVRLKPVDVVGLKANVRSIAAGSDHACAIMTAGGIKCWGNNDYGQRAVNPGWTPVEANYLAPFPQDAVVFLPFAIR